MDETKDTKQDSLPEKGQTSASDAGTTSTAKTYTEEEKAKAISDALAEKGRTAKDLEKREASLKAQEESIKAMKAEMDEWRKQRETAELEEAQADPDKLRDYQRRQVERQRKADLDTREADLKRQRAEFDREKAENAEEIKVTKETSLEIAIWKIASETGVKANDIKDAMKELNLTTIEQAKAVAKRLAPKDKGGETKTFTPDSGVTSGTFGTITPEQFEKLPISEKAKYLPK